MNLYRGGAVNRANDDITFRQRGLLNRRQIIPLIAEKLRKADKLVVVETV